MLEKTFDPKSIEDRHYAAMEKSGAFSANPASDDVPFTVMMPPPNVTGSLHMGHALNMTLQDILTRFNRMNGKDALWQPGTDHAGIATQMVVERQLDAEGLHRRDLGREAFLDRVWTWKGESGGTIVNQLRKLGATPDWDRERFTMDDGLSKAVTKVFVQLYKENLIYRDKRLVNWDPHFQTSISDLEVEQKEQKGKMWHIRYPVEGDQAEYITVATTRPETMLGDTAVAVHPEDERYTDMVGKNVVLPITGRIIPIVADEYSDPEKGSGAVKITPAHDFNDFEVGKRHNLMMISVLDERACIVKDNESIPSQYHGLDRFKARELILRELEELDALIEVEDIKNAVPYGDRSGVIIEPFLTDQWYVDAKTLAKPAIEAVETGKTRFVPKNWENTYFEWMRNIQPWCISRQLWWGHQIPAWYDENGKVYVAESLEAAQEQAGADAVLTRDEDVLDTWFSSALWPFSTLGWPDTDKEDVQKALEKYYPGDVLITGFDIIFFWVARMMMMGLHFMGDVPFKDVYIHALVRDAKGQKMSKSKGNVMDPLELIDKFGADALRFTLTAMAAQGRDIKLSEERVDGYRKFATKLWNASRYCEMNGCRPQAGFKPDSLTYTPNIWIVSALCETKDAVERAVQDYRFNEAANALYQFVWGTFCDWYLEFTKPLLQDDGADAKTAIEIKQTTGWVLEQIYILLNPFMPFITEELSDAMCDDKDALLMQGRWPEYPPGYSQDEAADKMDWLIAVISEIRSVRADMNVPASAKIKLLVKDACEDVRGGLEAFEEIICRMARIEAIELTDAAPKGSIQTVVGQATLILPIADIIDLDAERERLKKQISKLDADIAKINGKLGNDKFVANAPEEIIAEQKSRLAEAQMAREKFSSALEQLEAA
ncbi:MAG: valine--tRNA ligase [Micavibrio sp.]|nr:valine--tRNA ligase [Micavibrio sp.]|tara:strand:- start:12660 stop:15326 length:2667 start_codon:yes stop_codon:yes gene_type:complete